MFFMLALRLPAYRGVTRAVLQAQMQDEQGTTPRRVSGSQGRYERGSASANNHRTAATAPPATAATLSSLNAQLGGQWFVHRVVKPDA